MGKADPISSNDLATGEAHAMVGMIKGIGSATGKEITTLRRGEVASLRGSFGNIQRNL